MTRIVDQRGGASIEFILVLPIILLILVLSVELSRAWFQLNLATLAAREGVRAAVMAPSNSVSSTGMNRINQVMGQGNWTATVTCSTNPCAADSQVTANITLNFTNMFPLLLSMLPQPVVMQQTASMRHE